MASSAPQELTIRRPDDWHLHLRDDDVLAAVLAHRHFERAIIMPNLKPPVTTKAHAIAYRDEIHKALPPGSSFVPLMTLYLTDNTSPEEIKIASLDKLGKGSKPDKGRTFDDSGWMATLREYVRKCPIGDPR